MELRFLIDTKHRKQFFTGLSFSHPAKMSLPLQLWLIDNFTKEGEVILDPMAGSGTLLVACSMGRNVICVELEQKFVDMMQGNWEKIKTRGAQLGYTMGTATILQGDARNLTGILADRIITSPPFAKTTTYHDFKFMSDTADDQKERLEKGLIKGHNASVEARQRGFAKQASGIPESPDNISKLPYGNIDKIITSPPFFNTNLKKKFKSREELEEFARNTKLYKEGRSLEAIIRMIEKSWNAGEGVDKIITSPPYAETRPESSHEPQEAWQPEFKGRGKTYHNINPDNLGNLPYGSIDKVITSPPYEGSLQSGQDGIDDSKWTNKSLKSREQARAITRGYSDKVDAVITSPPYEGSLEGGSRHTQGGIPSRDKKLGQTGTYETLDDEAKRRVSSGFQSEEALKILRGSSRGYSASDDNIGNLKSTSYLQAMLSVYSQCYSVLKPKGLMILVTKDFIRNKKRVDLAGDTIKLCEQAGFSLLERHYRKLTSQSFWRVIYRRKYPDAPVLDTEDILIFKKDE